MGTEIVSKLARKELVNAIRERYDRASKGEKAKILDEFTIVVGNHQNDTNNNHRGSS